jgi:hypothetical protein
LATVRSKKEYFEVMKQLLDNGKREFMFSSSSASSSSGSHAPLGNKNEDDCYGILPSLQNPYKKRVFSRLLGSPVLSPSFRPSLFDFQTLFPGLLL